MNASPAPRKTSGGTPVDPITVEVIGNALSSIVEEMGETLVRAAYSTNIKERRDCSTALFNARGETLCQAEHIPIHLGSFLDLVPHIMRRYPTQDIRPGDAFIGNDAYEGGGTHLPDIVVAELEGMGVAVDEDGAGTGFGGDCGNLYASVGASDAPQLGHANCRPASVASAGPSFRPRICSSVSVTLRPTDHCGRLGSAPSRVPTSPRSLRRSTTVKRPCSRGEIGRAHV